MVRDDELVTANALTPTAGTLAFLVGLGGRQRRPARAGAALGVDGDVGVLLTAAALYAVAGSLALRIPRDLLGPDLATEVPAVREAVRHVARGLVDGLRHLAERRPAAYGLAAIGAHRFFYGVSALSLILLYRNYFHTPARRTPPSPTCRVAVLRQRRRASWPPRSSPRSSPSGSHRAPGSSGCWLGAAVTQVFPGALYTQPALLVAAFFLGLASQGIKIVVDTLVQTHVDDAFRGRVFSLYDVIFNVAFVAAAAVGARRAAHGRQVVRRCSPPSRSATPRPPCGTPDVTRADRR